MQGRSRFRRNTPLALVGGLALSFTLVSASPVSLAEVVVLYTVSGLDDLYKDVLPAFESKENVHVTIVTGGSGELVSRLTTEKGNPRADVIVTLPPFIQQAASDQVLVPGRLEADSHIPAGNQAPDGTWRTFIDNYFCEIQRSYAVSAQQRSAQIKIMMLNRCSVMRHRRAYAPGASAQ